MVVRPEVRAVFGHFQNLNLLALLNDLRSHHVARFAWSAFGQLCPVAHGMPSGAQVRALEVLGHCHDFARGCDYAARQLGAALSAVLRFVRAWDEGTLDGWLLLGELEELWQERLSDAVAVQALLQEAGVLREA